MNVHRLSRQSAGQTNPCPVTAAAAAKDKSIHALPWGRLAGDFLNPKNAGLLFIHWAGCVPTIRSTPPLAAPVTLRVERRNRKKIPSMP